jgi:hypothetical protein
LWPPLIRAPNRRQASGPNVSSAPLYNAQTRHLPMPEVAGLRF